MSNKEVYTTTDFYTVALLVHCDHDIIEITREDQDGNESRSGRVRRFHFEDTPQLKNDMMNFTNGKIEGNLKKFQQSIETVKNLVHS